jgi:hypothetical protein
MIKVSDYGAISGGVSDARAAIQAAMDANPGQEITGEGLLYLIGAAPGRFWALNVPAGTTLRDMSLVLAGGVPDSVQLLEVDAADVTLKGLVLNGNMANQTVSPHQQRHGIRCSGAPNVRIIDCEAFGFTGDGVFIYNASDNAYASGLVCRDNQRNGLTMGGFTNGGMFERCSFLRNGAQQFDTEGTRAISKGTLRNCRFEGGSASDDYVLTITGHTEATQSFGWMIIDCTIMGGVLFVDAADCVMTGCTINNSSSKVPVRIYRACDRILIYDNDIINSGPSSADMAAMVYVTGTNRGQSPGGIRILDNRMRTSTPYIGVTAICCRDIEIHDNQMVGAGIAQPSTPAVWVRATRVDEPTRSVSIRDNGFLGFGDTAIQCGGNGNSIDGYARILDIEITNNQFSDFAVVATMPAAVSLDDGTYHPVLRATESGNAMAGGCITKIARAPGGLIAATWGDGSRWIAPPSP